MTAARSLSFTERRRHRSKFIQFFSRSLRVRTTSTKYPRSVVVRSSPLFHPSTVYHKNLGLGPLVAADARKSNRFPVVTNIHRNRARTRLPYVSPARRRLYSTPRLIVRSRRSPGSTLVKPRRRTKIKTVCSLCLEFIVYYLLRLQQLLIC